jgi:hypothetical protein
MFAEDISAIISVIELGEKTSIEDYYQNAVVWGNISQWNWVEVFALYSLEILSV